MIDVVIPVYKPDAKFELLIAGLAKQSRKPDTITIMYTVSGEGNEWHKLQKKAIDILAGNSGEKIQLNVYPVNKNDFYHGRTRNRGVAYGTNPYVLCMTQDAVPADGRLLEQMMEDLEMNPEVSQVYARQMTDDRAPDYIAYTQSFNYPEKRILKNKNSYVSMGIKTIFCSNVCCMYRRDIFNYLGGFEDKVIFNEDMIYARKSVDAGYTIIYEGFTGVIHYHEYTLVQQFKRNFDLAVSQVMNKEAFKGLSSTSEGKKMVKDILSLLWSKKKYGTALYYVLLSAFKYLGYVLGKKYKHLPRGLKIRFSASPSFWREG